MKIFFVVRGSWLVIHVPWLVVLATKNAKGAKVGWDGSWLVVSGLPLEETAGAIAHELAGAVRHSTIHQHYFHAFAERMR